MLQKEKIDSRIWNVLEQMEQELGFQKNGLLTINRLIVFAFIEGRSENQRPSSYCSSCITEINRLKSNLIKNDSVSFLYLPCDAPDRDLARQFRLCLHKAGENHVVDNLQEIWLCPVVLGGSIYTKQNEDVEKIANKIAAEWICLQKNATNQMGVQIHWQPYVLLESLREGVINRRSCLKMTQYCVRQLREVLFEQHMIACNRVCLITEKDENGQMLSLVSRMRSVLLNVLVQVLAHSQVRDVAPRNVEDCLFYSASAVSLTAPVRYHTLSKIGVALNRGLSQGARTVESPMDVFARELTKLPEKVFWEDRLSQIPRTNGTVTTEPVWSVVCKNDGEDDRRIAAFVNEYYLSVLRVEATENNNQIFEKKFLELYFSIGGSLEDLAYFTNLHGDEALMRLSQKVRDYSQFNVWTSRHEHSENEKYYQAEQKLALQMREMPAAVLGQFLDKNSRFILQMREKVAQLLEDKNLILQELETCRNRWCYDEIILDSQNPEQTVFSQDTYGAYMQELQKRLIMIMGAKKEKRSEMMLSLLDFCFQCFHGEIINRSDYMRRLTDYVQNATKEEYEELFSVLKLKLKLPVYLNAIDRDQEQFFLLGSDTHLLRKLRESFRAAECIPLNADEQIELLRLSQPFSIDNTLGIG